MKLAALLILISGTVFAQYNQKEEFYEFEQAFYQASIPQAEDLVGSWTGVALSWNYSSRFYATYDLKGYEQFFDFRSFGTTFSNSIVVCIDCGTISGTLRVKNERTGAKFSKQDLNYGLRAKVCRLSDQRTMICKYTQDPQGIRGLEYLTQYEIYKKL